MIGLTSSILFVVIFSTVASQGPHEDANLTMVEMLAKYGYPSEVHYVKTQDNYILKAYRIPYGRNCGPDQQRKLPIILMHGFQCNSIDFILAGVDNGLGYILADECYDVWIPNSRGNFESKNHTMLDPDGSAFWKFSFHEMGQYDIPALIDHILKTSGEKQVHYIGHSQGTTQFFVYASLYPEESGEKVKSMHALAPVAFMTNMSSPLGKWIGNHLDQLEYLQDVLGWDQFVPQSNEWIHEMGGKACIDLHPNLEMMCENLLFVLCGFDGAEFNTTLLPIITAHDPAGAATKQVVHFGQEYVSGEFCQYDYGEEENLKLYGTALPPNYPIEKIKVPLYLHYADNDWLASTLDVEKFASLTKTSVLRKVPLPQFNHLDFLWAIDVKELLFNEIVETLNKS